MVREVLAGLDLAGKNRGKMSKKKEELCSPLSFDMLLMLNLFL